MTMKRITLFVFACIALLVAAKSFALDPVYTTLFSNKAIGGYDAVSYFTNGKPVAGSKQHSFEYQGATWLFATAENRKSFEAQPQKYAPQYGGYCAWAVAQGYDAPGDPEFWKIVDGKLYLNYNAKVQAQWDANVPGFIKSADENWPKLLK
jgi:YHS domain-containing protein